MKPTPLTPKLLPSVSGCSLALQLAELTSEEAAVRHRLELRVERALYRAAVVLQAVYDGEDSGSAHQYLNRGWQNEQKVQRARSEVEIALQELRTHRLCIREAWER